MADDSNSTEVVEDLPVSVGGGRSPSNAWVPVIVVIILLPILSFVTTEFLLLPRIKSEILHSTGGGAGDEGASSHAAPAKEDAGGHGGGHGGDKAGAQNGLYEFETMKTNLSRPSSTLIIVRFSVKGTGPGFNSLMEANKAALTDATLKILSLLTLVDTGTPGIQNIVKQDLISAFNEVVGEPAVENLFFTDFVTQ